MRRLNIEVAEVLVKDDAYRMSTANVGHSYAAATAYAEPPVLTSTERAIVEQLASGHCSKEIATRLNRSRATVEFHVRSLFVKLNARSRAHIVARAFDAGILPTEKSIESSL